MIKFTIPGIPVAKGRPRFTKSGIAYTPAKTRQYENLVKAEAFQAMEKQPLFENAVEIVIRVFLPIPKSFSKTKKEQCLLWNILPITRPDLDNYIKAVLDGCNKIVFKDDSQIVDIAAQKFYSDKPRIEVEIIGID